MPRTAMRPIHFLRTITRPRLPNEDQARREFILNVLLVSVIGIFALALLNNLVEQLFGGLNPISLLILVFLLLFFCSLYALSRVGRITLSSFLLIGALFSFATYMAYRWGVDLHAVLFFYILATIMTGVLISSRAAFITTGCVSLVILALGTLQESGMLHPNRYWIEDIWTLDEIAVIAILFLIIATVSWLSNREIEKSLVRARRSEAELKKERDNLEARVIERTEELRKAELERMSQAYRFVEFGRLASSIFHDLGSPLTALSLNIESIARGAGDTRKLARIADDIERARSATAHMQKLMGSMRRHLAREGSLEPFSFGSVIREAVRVLGSYARQRNVSLRFEGAEGPAQYGDPVAFMQVFTNLASNAIESFPPSTGPRAGREVLITLATEPGQTVVTIRDTGPGMDPETLERVFEPFFSTKGETGGLGIGLPLARRVLEKDFGGTMSVASAVGGGTAFTLYFPVREP